MFRTKRNLPRGRRSLQKKNFCWHKKLKARFWGQNEFKQMEKGTKMNVAKFLASRLKKLCFDIQQDF